LLREVRAAPTTGDVTESAGRPIVLQLADRAQAGAVGGRGEEAPLPRQVSPDAIIAAIPPAKDVDGLNPISAGNLFVGRPGLRPWTPAGVMKLIEETGAALAGLRAVVVGRSNLVGKPMAIMLLQANATVTLCHSKSDIRKEVADADVLVVAVGVAELVKGAWIKPGAVVIDVGMNCNAAGKLIGHEQCRAHCSTAQPRRGGTFAPRSRHQ
jgi:methylenetetrahydrofolate dehydrogenase (NADP+)/methenyltetrahydrofolate cyclohydrolase